MTREADHAGTSRRGGDFASRAEEKERGLIWEFLLFLRQSKKWWLTPILIMLLLLGVLVIVGSTGVGPFIYTLF